MWIDSHCHITAPEFDVDREGTLERARAAGVSGALAIGSGYGIEGNAAALALASEHADIFAAVGVHPHEADEFGDNLRGRLRAWLSEPGAVALGECGLDYHYMNSPRETQRSVLAEQLSWARELDMPVSVHVRGDAPGEPNAYEELLDIWCAEGRGDLRGVLHCYTGSLDFARRALEVGFRVSFSGILTFNKSESLREVARALPLDRLLVETDAPFLAPQGRRGKRNEPAWVVRVGEVLAELKGLAAEEVARQTTENVRTLFTLPT